MSTQFDIIVRKLSQFYAAEEINEWLNTKQTQLDGKSALELMINGEYEPVLKITSAMSDADFL